MFKLINNFMWSLIFVIYNIFAEHKILTTKKIAKARLKLCKQCTDYDLQSNRCKLCGCYMKLKVKLISSYCVHKEPKWLNIKKQKG